MNVYSTLKMEILHNNFHAVDKFKFISENTHSSFYELKDELIKQQYELQREFADLRENN
jgi:hypothetical protein